MPRKTSRPYLDILRDPLVRQVMAADGVCPSELQSLLNEVTDRLADQSKGREPAYIVLRSQTGEEPDSRQFGMCNRLLRMACSPTLH